MILTLSFFIKTLNVLLIMEMHLELEKLDSTEFPIYKQNVHLFLHLKNQFFKILLPCNLF